MTLRSQLAIAVSILLFLIFVLLAVFDARQSRDYLDYQLSRTAQDTANSLALSVQSAWQDEPDIAILTSQVDALFTQGLYQEVLIQDNGGSNLAAERAAGFRLTEAEHLLNDAQREVVELAHQAWNAYMTTKQQLVYLDMFVDSAVNTREAYAQQFTINRRTLQEVLDSEVEVFDARSARVEAEADHVIADLQLAASQGQLIQVMQQQAN